MASNNIYDQVSSLYGPGTTGCWYLTVLSSVVSWTVHPHKRVSGSLDPDFIAVLTFPVVAAAHLISQIRNGSGCNAGATILDAQSVAAIEASLNITEISLTVLSMLFLIAVGSQCVRRAFLLAIIGLFCLFAEAYLFLSCPALRSSTRNLFTRSFLINFSIVLLVIISICLVQITSAISLITIFYATRKHYVPPAHIDPELRMARLQQNRDFLDSNYVKTIALLSMLFLPASYVVSLIPLGTDIFTVHPSSTMAWFRATGARLICRFFPRTAFSVTDLDQAVAATAGATVLCFSIYSAADAQYKSWYEREERLAAEAVELRRSR